VTQGVKWRVVYAFSSPRSWLTLDKNWMWALTSNEQMPCAGLESMFQTQGQIQGEGAGLGANHPPLWGHLSLKLWKGTELSLRRFCRWLLRYHSVRSAPPSPQKSWIRHDRLGLTSTCQALQTSSHNFVFCSVVCAESSLRWYGKCAYYASVSCELPVHTKDTKVLPV